MFTKTSLRQQVSISVAAQLPEGCFYYNGQNRCVFNGAEVYYDPDDSDDEFDEDEGDKGCKEVGDAV